MFISLWILIPLAVLAGVGIVHTITAMRKMYTHYRDMLDT